MFSSYKLFIINNTCSLFFSHNYSLFCSHSLHKHYRNTCSYDLYSGDLQNRTVLFTRNASSHKTDWITTDCSLLCITNILEMERSCSRLLENSIKIFLFVYNVHSCCVCLHCAFITYLFHTHTDVVVCSLITCSM